MENIDALDKAISFVQKLKEKYGESVWEAYVQGHLTTNDRIAYEIVAEVFCVG